MIRRRVPSRHRVTAFLPKDDGGATEIVAPVRVVPARDATLLDPPEPRDVEVEGSEVDGVELEPSEITEQEYAAVCEAVAVETEESDEQ